MSSLLIFDCRTHDPPDFILTSLGSFFFDIVKYSTIFVCYQLDNILKLYLLSLSPLPCVPSILYPLSSFSSTAQHFLLIRNSYVDSSLPLSLSTSLSLSLFPSLSLSLSLHLSISFPLSLSISVTPSLSISLSISLSHSLDLSLCLSLSLSHTLLLSLSHSLFLSLSLPLSTSLSLVYLLSPLILTYPIILYYLSHDTSVINHNID